MTKRTHASDASLTSTTASTFPESVRRAVPALPATLDARVVMLAPITVPAPLPEGFVEVDTLVESEESDPHTKEAIAAGRRAIADNYYAQAPRTLSALRLGNGWSQKELAQRLGTSQSYVARLEAGSIDPQVSTLRRLAAVLSVEPGLLLDVITAGAKRS